MTDLLVRVARFRPFRVLVVGDFMLDQQVFGAAERLSPDAPVPVLHVARTEDRPGGASNVALCLKALRGEVACFGVVGDDAEGRSLRAALEAEGITCAGIVADGDRPTTIKRSLVGLAQHRHPQKMFRLDYESRSAIAPEIEQAILDRFDAALDDAAIVCLEDYDKGVCTPGLCARLIERCRERGKPIIVDPAAIDDYAKYRGATAITPNRSEAERATGLGMPIDANELHNAGLAARLGRELELEAVVLTLDRHGALLEERGGRPVLVPTVARSVYDVTGAGDVVLAALAAARANGLTWLQSVELANAAAGLEVEVFGVQPIPLAAIRRELLARAGRLAGKVRELDDLLVEIAVHREQGRRVVFTNGCFDVLHAGHVGYLREARRQGDLLVVAVNDDAQVRIQKGEGRPVYPLADRLDVLGELQCVDYLVTFDTPTVRDLLRAIRPEVYVKGGDYRPEEINELDVIRELGLDLRLLANRPGLGSTQVIERLRSIGE